MKIFPAGNYPNKVNSNLHYGSGALIDPTISRMAAMTKRQLTYDSLPLAEQVTRDLQEMANLAKERFDEAVINLAIER